MLIMRRLVLVAVLVLIVAVGRFAGAAAASSWASFAVSWADGASIAAATISTTTITETNATAFTIVNKPPPLRLRRRFVRQLPRMFDPRLPLRRLLLLLP